MTNAAWTACEAVHDAIRAYHVARSAVWTACVQSDAWAPWRSIRATEPVWAARVTAEELAYQALSRLDGDIA